MPTPQLRDQLQRSLGSAYTLQRELGGGGMSRVFVAEETALARMVVIKVLSPDLAQGLSADRFAREIRLAARLQHPHIVPLFSAGEVDGLPYYTMPYVEGESLRALLAREGALPIARVMQVLRDIARALDYAHAQDIVHRDIKPDNVLLSGNAASVTDFGIAKAVTAARAEALPAEGSGETLTQLGVAIGTPAYMAPEQAAGDPDVDHRADLYAFGCVAYEMLAGQPPFHDRPPRAMLVAHMVEMPASIASRRRDAPRSLSDLVMRCLAKTPEGRPANAAEILAVIESSSTASRTAVTPLPTASIAVLPFESMSADRENEYFADGISEEIINALTQLDGLRVAGRTSSFSFKGTKHDLHTIGEKLNVDTLLEGSVRKSGNRLRITAQLIKVSDGYHLWSERYDREMTDVFAVQDEIATAIASKLKLTLGRPGEMVKPPTDNIEAYELFLKGRVLLYRRGRFIFSATRCFERAVALDDRFAQAQAALADCLSLSGFYGLVPATEIIDRANAAAMRAVKLAPDLAEARHALALWMTYFGSDREAAIEEWERALTVGQQSTQVRCSYALWRWGFLVERWDEAVIAAQQGVAADPLSGYANSMLALVKSFAGNHAEMVADAMHGVDLDPESFWSHWVLQRVYHSNGQYDEAMVQARVTLGMSGRHPWSLSELAVTYARKGNHEAAEAIFGELVSRSKLERIQPSTIALAAICAGRLDEAIAMCHRAIDERDAYIRWSTFDQWDGWQPLYVHPGWKEVRQRILNW
jgi:serine/threonine-protein kinase